MEQLRFHLQLPAEGLEEPQPLLQAVQQGDTQVRPQQLHGDGGEPRPGAHIHKRRPGGKLPEGQGQDAIHKVLHSHPPVIGDGGEVHFLVPLLEQPAVPGKFLVIPQKACLPEQGLKFLPWNHFSASPFLLRLSSQIISTETSAGLTPLMRLA